MSVEHFFRTARERYHIMLRRRSKPEPPWTEDPLFRVWKFTCVHREDDYTTTWLRENIRSKQRDNPTAALMSTVAFRWFNRPETGELLKPVLLSDQGWDPEQAAEILNNCGNRVLFTAAYIIRSDFGEPKKNSIYRAINEVYRTRHTLASEITHFNSIEKACELLNRFHLMGTFMAYEVASDLRWTCLLEEAPDIMTWASPGPGAARGLGRVLFDNPGGFNYVGGKKQQGEMLNHMRELLAQSKNPKLWPAEWRPWEMREVEHWLCEYDKYERARLGQGHPKQRFVPRPRS